MKDRIQAKLLAEYESRKDEFPSYMAFIRATAAESDWVRRLRTRLARSKNAGPHTGSEESTSKNSH